MAKEEDEKLVGATVELLAPHFIGGTLRGVRDDDRVIKNYTGPKSLQMRVISKGKTPDPTKDDGQGGQTAGGAGATGGEQK